MEKVAILVDGGFYKKRARLLFGDKTPEARANELVQYCMRHVKGNYDKLYRIFYYDCPPADKNIHNPLNGTSFNLQKQPQYNWNKEFFKKIVSKRKVALRLGEFLEGSMEFVLKPGVLKRLCKKEITVDDLTLDDLVVDMTQKGVDMRIGLDISSIAFKKQATKIILIAGDSDFVPAAKHARREGIDFVLDPMWHNIKDSLYEHIDGLHSVTCPPGSGQHDPLCMKPKTIASKKVIEKTSIPRLATREIVKRK